MSSPGVSSSLSFGFGKSVGSAVFPVLSPIWNLAFRYCLCLSVNLVRRDCIVFSAGHPIMAVGAVGSDGPLDSSPFGALLAPQCSLVTYSIMVLSYSVSCSSVLLCVPQSTCFTKDECRLNILTHPSSGHVDNRELLTVDTVSLSKLSSVSTVAGCWRLVRLGRTGTKLILAFRSVEGLTSIVGTVSHLSRLQKECFGRPMSSLLGWYVG